MEKEQPKFGCAKGQIYICHPILMNPWMISRIIYPNQKIRLKHKWYDFTALIFD